MAVTSIPNSSRVLIYVQVGVDENGKGILRARTYNNVKPAAADADVYDLATKIGSLQVYPLINIRRIDSEDLVNAG